MAFNFTYTVGFLADTKDLTEKINAFSGSLKTKKFDVATKVPGAANAPEIQKFIDNLRTQAKEVTKVDFVTRQMTDATGKSYKEITQAVVKYIDKVTGLETIATKDSGELKNLDKKVKSYDALAKKAIDWGTRAETMGAKEKAAIQGSSSALLKLIEDYKTMARTDPAGAAKKFEDAIKKQTVAFEEEISASKRAANAVKGWGDSFNTALKQVVSFGGALALVRAAQNFLNDGIRYAIELNKEMVKIQVLQAEGAQSPEEIKELALAYNGLAKEMGVTTIEVAQGSVEWLRQGKSIAETTELLRASTMLSKLGNLSAAESTEYLTSTINSYKMASKDAVSVVDKLVAVDNMSATSTKELATALRYSAATADQAGVSLEQLISYIGVISSVTRMNAESIGQAMKTMLTRMQDIKAGQIDEDGLGLNNVESALARVNIKLRDSETSFRDMGAVLEDVAAKWDTLNEIEQANISKAIAGVRQANMFTVLMTNMGQALELQKIQYDAAGTAADRYKIYLEGVEAAQNKFKASLEGIWQKAITSGQIKMVIDLGIAIVDLVDKLGGLPTVLGLVVVAWAILNVEMINTKIISAASMIQGIIGVLFNLIPALAGSTTGTMALAAAIEFLNTTNPVGWIAIAVGLLTALGAGIYYATQATARHTKAWEENAAALDTASDAVRNYQESIGTTQDLVNRYEELAKKVGKSSDELKEFRDIQNKLKDMFPELAGTWDDNLNFQISSKNISQQILDIEKEKLQVLKDEAIERAKAAAISAMEVKGDKEKSLKHEMDTLSNLRDQYDAAKQQLIDMNFGMPMSKGDRDDLIANDPTLKLLESQISAQEGVVSDAERAAKEFEVAFRNVYGQLGETARKAFIEELDPSGTNKELQAWIADIKNKQAADEAYATTDKDITNRFGYKTEEKLGGTATSDIAYASAIKEIGDGLKDINSLKQSIAENGGILSPDQIEVAQKLGLSISKDVNGNLTVAAGEFDRVTQSVYDNSDAFYNLSPELQAVVQQYFAAQQATQTYTSEIKDVTSALQEQADTGYVSAATASKLMASYAGLADALTWTEKGYILDKDAAILDIEAKLALILKNYDLQISSLDAAGGVYALTQTMINQANMTPAVIAQIQNYIDVLNKLKTTNFVSGGGSGGGGGKSAEQIRIEAEIKALEKKKKALQDQLKEFKKYIDAQKEALKLAREQDKFDDEMLKKTMSLAKMKARIALLSLDDSEEATAERLKLQEEAGQLETEITEDKEDRKYELQVQALDKVYEAFEEMINKQIEAIDKLIETLREQASAMQGAMGGATNTFIGTMKASFGAIIDALITMKVPIDSTVLFLIGRFQALGLSAEETAKKIKAALDAQRAFEQTQGRAATQNTQAGAVVATEGQGVTAQRNRIYSVHTGGLIESHHDGEFAGNLKSNEVYAKLLKGEYVATEGQMQNFMSNILPKIASTPSVEPIGAGKTEISMPISVAGNLDKAVLPDLEKMVNKSIQVMTSTLMNRGYKRAVDQVL